MANIRKIVGVDGRISYKITVSHGRDAQYRQLRHYKTFTPPPGWSEKRAEKEVQKVALQFEEEVRQGFQLDNRQLFTQYARYYIDLRESGGAKHNTILLYRHLLNMVDPHIGGLKLADIRPQHLNNLYKRLQTEEMRLEGAKATDKGNLAEKLKAAQITREALAKKGGMSAVTVTKACRGEPIMLEKAKALSEALGVPVSALFNVTKNDKPLSAKTALEAHRFIHAVLAQAEKEMLVPYNAASKATAPAAKRKAPNYFQPETVSAILEALEALEPEQLKWKVFTHLLIVTGRRRGEIAGLQWSCVDLEAAQLHIKQNLCYSKEKGIYLTSTKTGTEQFIKIPAETVELLREYKRAQLELRLLNGDRWVQTDFVFTRDNGEPMAPASITKWLNDFSKRNGLPHINPHAFRHTAASLLIAEGTDLVTVAAQLGHAQTSTTADIYAHAIEEAKARASETIADKLLRKKKA